MAAAGGGVGSGSLLIVLLVASLSVVTVANLAVSEVDDDDDITALAEIFDDWKPPAQGSKEAQKRKAAFSLAYAQCSAAMAESKKQCLLMKEARDGGYMAEKTAVEKAAEAVSKAVMDAKVADAQGNATLGEPPKGPKISLESKVCRNLFLEVQSACKDLEAKVHFNSPPAASYVAGRFADRVYKTVDAHEAMLKHLANATKPKAAEYTD